MTDLLAGVPADIVGRFRLDLLPFAQKEATLGDLVGLRGLRVVVTGGAGGGLGQATCNRLAAQGAEVVVFDADGDGATTVAEGLTRRWGTRAVACKGSVSDWDDAHRAMRFAVEELGGLDTLVNNAGGLFGSQFGLFAGRSQRNIDAMIRLNLLGVFYCTHAALEVMVAQGRGRIVNVASEGGKVGMAILGVYNACKTGVTAFTRSIAAEVGALGVSVAGVAPGIMVSPGLLALMQRPAEVSAAVTSIADGFTRTTIGRCSLPEEVANMIAFLCSPAAAFVHGTTVSVGGGISS